jgi:hypothetical protein
MDGKNVTSFFTKALYSQLDSHGLNSSLLSKTKENVLIMS